MLRPAFLQFLLRLSQVIKQIVLVVFRISLLRIRQGDKHLIPVYIREGLSNLGATFVKFGQILAMRPDFLPQEYCNEFLKLVDEVPPFSNNVAREIIKNELAGLSNELITSLSEEPIAAASFGQVYLAKVPPDQDVVVKVQRPGIENVVEWDLKIINFVIKVLDLSINIGGLKYQKILQEFEKWTREELDYIKEACYAQSIFENSYGIKTEKIPRLYWAYCTKRILVQEFLKGKWMKDIQLEIRNSKCLFEENLSKSKDEDTKYDQYKKFSKENLKVVARNLVSNFLHQVFDNGIFHGDPHAGNLVVLEGNTIGYIDFGITGTLDLNQRRKILNLFLNLSEGNVDGAYYALIDVIQPPSYLDLRQFEIELKQNIEDWLILQHDQRSNSFEGRRQVLQEKSMARLIYKNLEIMRKHGVLLPNVVVRYYRALAIIDVMVLELTPEINFREEFLKFFRRKRIKRALEKFSPKERIMNAIEINQVLHSLPNRINQFLETTKFVERKVELRYVTLKKLVFFILRTFKNIAMVVTIISFILWINSELEISLNLKGLLPILKIVQEEGIIIPIFFLICFLMFKLFIKALAKYEIKNL